METTKKITITKANQITEWTFSEIVDFDSTWTIHHQFQVIIDNLFNTSNHETYVKSIKIESIDYFDFESMDLDFETRAQYEIKDIEDNMEVLRCSK